MIGNRIRRSTVVVLTLGVVVTFASAAWSDDAADVKAAIEQHYKLFQSGDSEASVERFHLDEFTMFPGDGGLLWEADFQAVADRMGASSTVAPRSVSMTNYNTQIHGDVAVATFYLVGTVDDEPVTNRVSAVWVRTNNVWKEAHHHESPLEPGGIL
jgi:ketosteroid isomerase-like protein